MTITASSGIYVSYAWGGDSGKLVDDIERTFCDKGVVVIRDKNEVKYKDRITDYMRQLGQGRCVIVVISASYLTSKNCMFELMEIARHGEFAERIFPVVLSSAGVYDAHKRLEYVKHWDAEINRLNQAIKGIESQANLQSFHNELEIRCRW